MPTVAAASAGVQPAHIGQAGGVLHRDALVPEPFVLLGHGEDEVAELAKAGVGAVGRRLAAVEVDRPATERDGGGRPALRADDAGRPGRGAHPGQAALDDDDAPDAGLGGEHRRPAADRSRPDDHEIGSFRHATPWLAVGSRPATG